MMKLPGLYVSLVATLALPPSLALADESAPAVSSERVTLRVKGAPSTYVLITSDKNGDNYVAGGHIPFYPLCSRPHNPFLDRTMCSHTIVLHNEELLKPHHRYYLHCSLGLAHAPVHEFLTDKQWYMPNELTCKQ